MCFVLGLFFWKMLDSPLFRIKETIHGICHCTHLGISILNCVRFFGPAAHDLIGCVKTSKVGTKQAVKKQKIVYLGQLGKQINEAELFDIMLLAGHGLVNVLKQGTPCTTNGLHC